MRQPTFHIPTRAMRQTFPLEGRFAGGFAAVLGLIGAALLAGVAPSAAAQAERPNVVLIMADDLGYSDIGSYGGEIDTPNLDRLARGGLRFTHFYNAGRCVPSRASLMTGLYAHQAGIGHMAGDFAAPAYRDFLSPQAVTIPEVLRAVGYRTLMAGKWHLGWRDEGSPTARGFDRFYGTRGYVDSYYDVVPRTDVYLDDRVVIAAGEAPVNHLHPDREWYTTDVYTDYALHFIDEAIARDQPFFLYLAYNAPHFPLHARPEELAKYRGRYGEIGWTELRRRRFQRLRELGILDRGWRLSPDDAPAWDSLPEAQKEEADLRMALYAAIVDRLDQNIGRVIEKLERSRQLDNTLIVFLSDNGGTSEGGLFGIASESSRVDNYDEWARKGGWTSSYGRGWANLSNVPFRSYKRYVHEGGVSAPFIVQWPRGIGDVGALRRQPAHITDLLPTIAEAAGAPYPESVNGREITPLAGRSLLPAFADQPIDRQAIFWEHEGNRAVRQGRWKLVAKWDDPWELYDIEADRTELYDLSARHPEKVRELTRLYDRWARRSGVLPWSEFLRIREQTRQRMQ